MRYRAFLSYSHADRRWARWLHRALEAYRPPKRLRGAGGEELPRRLTPIFRDRDELPTAASLSAAVSEALEQSEKLILICSPTAARSRWVNEEIRTFRRLGRGENILCLIVDGEPGAGDESECFPPALTDTDVAGEAPLEPVAADARPQGDGRRNALLKLIAGMLGVGYDAVKQRDLRRRLRRMIAIASGSLAIAVITVVLAITATIARRDAEVRRTQAEDLVDFMLGDLTERLREIGRLDIYESVGDEVLAYFSRQRDADVSDRTLAQRAKNLRQIGEVRMDQGNLDGALVAFQEALLIAERAATHDPADAELQISLANSLFYIGHVEYLRGNLDAAQEQFEKVLPIVDALSANDPTNTRWLTERGYAYTNLGRVYELDGRLEEALAAYETVMQTDLRLVELEPDNEDAQLEVGFAHNNLGKVVIGLGRLDEAEAHFRRDVEIKSRVLAGHPEHNMWRDYLGASRYFLGQLLVDRGRFAEAAPYLQAARDDYDFLLGVDASRTYLQWRRANIERELGRLYGGERDASKAEEAFAESIRRLDALVQEGADNTQWRRDLVRSLLTSASFEIRAGRAGLARSQLSNARQQLAVLLEKEPRNRETRQLAIYSDVCNARIEAATDSSAAVASAQQALEALARQFPDTADPQLLTLKARALAAVGQSRDADALLQQLRAVGYDFESL